MPTVSDAVQLAPELLTEPSTVDSSDPAVCDIAETLAAIDSLTNGSEQNVLNTLNLLDDVMITLRQRDTIPNMIVLDRLTSELFLGKNLDDAVASVGGRAAASEIVFTSVGRLAAMSTFRR